MTSAACGTFKGKYSREVYYSMSMAQQQQLYELQHKEKFRKGNKTPENSKTLETWVAVLEWEMNSISDESLFVDEKPIASNRNNPALDRKGNRPSKRFEDKVSVS